MADERIYLAGPEVFLPDPMAAAAAKKAICARHGFVGVFPLDKSLDLGGLAPFEAGWRISAANEQLMRGCDLIIANMTPFRGPSMDVGTAFEMGFMRALGRLVLGYSNDGRGFAERTRACLDIAPGASDADGMAIEEFGMADNLMMHGAVAASGATVEVTQAPPDARFTALDAFARCVAQARALLS
ncbi:MAG: nucleoside 2-deoxyribosyltransferase [Alphaproteobacteria bacterium]